jgi:hypothetical protein
MKQKMYDNSHESRKVGNPQDDTNILISLKLKRKIEDLKYARSSMIPKIKDKEYQKRVMNDE